MFETDFKFHINICIFSNSTEIALILHIWKGVKGWKDERIRWKVEDSGMQRLKQVKRQRSRVLRYNTSHMVAILLNDIVIDDGKSIPSVFL